MIGCANPIYLTSKLDYRPGAKLTFEVLEADASYLKRLLGKVETFGFDLEHAPFCAQLTSLQPCESRVLALGLLRDKPAMRGVLTIHGTINLANEN